MKRFIYSIIIVTAMAVSVFAADYVIREIENNEISALFLEDVSSLAGDQYEVYAQDGSTLLRRYRSCWEIVCTYNPYRTGQRKGTEWICETIGSNIGSKQCLVETCTGNNGDPVIYD